MTTSPKERPILFRGAMVRAILDGRKTQTRRVVKLPHNNPLGEWEATTVGGGSTKFADGTPAPEMSAIWHTRTGDTLTCPHGQPGDRLWVRETHLNWWMKDEGNPSGPRVFSHVAAYAADDYELEPGEKWIPSIHMLRPASRITLEITGVRVERLNDCSEKDALSEGVSMDRAGGHFVDGPAARHVSAVGAPAVHAFRSLWESINGSGAWTANPWVWVVEFKRITP